MSEQTKPDATPDDLTKTTEPETIELAEEELSRISGGDISFNYTKIQY